jgi:nitrate reductase (cytochrome)
MNTHESAHPANMESSHEERVRLQRRDFLRTAAMATATAVAAGSDAVRLPVLSASEITGELNWNKAPCRFCGTGCHVQVGVQDGKIVAIAGDRNAEVNKGLLCVKGYHVGSVLYGKDRLTSPLLRKGDSYEAISWEAAIEVIANRIVAAPERFAM